MSLCIERPAANVELDRITAREIEVYRKLEAELKGLASDVERRRRDMAARIRAGVKVEVGPWIPQVVRIEARQFSAAQLERILGRSQMELLRDRLIPTSRELFGLVPREGWAEDEHDDDSPE